MKSCTFDTMKFPLSSSFCFWVIFTLFTFQSLKAATFVWKGEGSEQINEYCSTYQPKEKIELASNFLEFSDDIFVNQEKNLINIGLSLEGVLLKLQIENQSNEDIVLLEINNHFIDSVALFENQLGTYSYLNSVGVFTGKYNMILELEIAKGKSKEYLLYMEDNGPFRFNVNVWNKNYLDKKRAESSVFWAFISGIFCFIFLLNLLFYFSIKDKLYLVYAFLVLAYLYTMLGNSGYVHPVLNQWYLFKSLDLRSTFNISLIFFTVQFLKYLFPSIPKLFHKGIFIISFTPLLIILQFFSFFGSDTLMVFCYGLFYLISVFFILLFIAILSYSVYHKFKSSYLLLMSYSPIIFLYMLNLLRAFHIIDVGFIFTNFMLAAILFEVLLMTIVVCLRFISYKAEKEKYELELVNQQMEFSNKLLFAQELERKKIAGNLHDGVGQVISGLKMRLSSFMNKNGQEFSEDQHEKMNEFIDLTENAYQEVRNISHELMPKSLQENGLSLALETLMQMTFKDTSFQWNFEALIPTEKRFNENIEISLYRVTQEALTNIIKYSKAQNVAVQLYQLKNTLFLIIEDDGIGFEMKNEGKGIGLRNIETRVNFMDGKLHIDSQLNEGTVITIKVNLKNNEK